jgi:hypothetical protein
MTILAKEQLPLIDIKSDIELHINEINESEIETNKLRMLIQYNDEKMQSVSFEQLTELFDTELGLSAILDAINGEVI